LAYGKNNPGFDTLLKQGGGPQIVIGTAGRIASLVKKNMIDYNKLKTIVIDEIDSVLDSDFRKDLLTIMGNIGTKSHIQTVGFGASNTHELMNRISNDIPGLSGSAAAQIDLLSEALKRVVTDRISHSLVIVPDEVSRRISVLVSMVCSTRFNKAIIFGNTIDEVRSIVNHPLITDRARALHGELDQAERDKILNAFRADNTKVKNILVCTDITARGIDISGVDLVLSLRPPVDPTSYIHRAGRTGRYKSTGESVLLVSPQEKRKIVGEIESQGKIKFSSKECPSKTAQQEIAVQGIVDAAIEIGAGSSDKFKCNISELMKNNKNDQLEKIIAQCMSELLGDMVTAIKPRNKSILSGQLGCAPVLFVDPTKSWIPDRLSLDMLLEGLKLSPGLISIADSGYIVDLPIEQALRLTSTTHESGNDIIILKKLPKLVKDDAMKGKKFRGVLPWRLGAGRDKTRKRKS